MEYQKNQEVIVEIDDIGNNGEGIGHINGYALFVKDALPGETVRARIMKCKKNYAFARLLEILPGVGGECAVGRVQPRCPVARQCGGCTLQHLSYEKQLAFKERKVYNCLKRIGGVEFGEDVDKRFSKPTEDGNAVQNGEGEGKSVEGEYCEGKSFEGESEGASGGVEWMPILGMEEPWHYRNKAQFPVRMQKTPSGEVRPVTGFYAGRTHSVIPVTDCAIQDGCMKVIIEEVLRWMEENRVSAYDEETCGGIVRHIYIRRGYQTGEIMTCLVVNRTRLGDALCRSLVERLTKISGMTSIFLNVNTENTNVILGREMILLWGKECIEDRIGDIRYLISPQSFYQVNPIQTEKLYETVLEFAELSGGETVWDLYCGIGTISLFLARWAKKVYGVEIVPEAVANARENARLNGIGNVKFFCGAAEEVVAPAAGKNGFQADVVVVDPPRKGCDETLLSTIVRMAPERIVYVSCDPATLARDVRVLGERGYEVRRVRTCDMFAHGGHVETIALLQKSNRKCASNEPKSELAPDLGECRDTARSLQSFGRKPDTYVKLSLDMEDYYRIMDAEGNARMC